MHYQLLHACHHALGQIAPGPTCASGMEFRSCGSACPPSCENQGQPVTCTLQCVSGCFCISGLVALEDSCVPLSECPQQTCTNGKEFRSCGTACPRTCDNVGETITCTRQCVSGCFCPSGTVELGDTCVDPSNCPTKPPPTTACECTRI